MHNNEITDLSYGKVIIPISDIKPYKLSMSLLFIICLTNLIVFPRIQHVGHTKIQYICEHVNGSHNKSDRNILTSPLLHNLSLFHHQIINDS